MPKRIEGFKERIARLERIAGPKWIVALPSGKKVSLVERREKLLERMQYLDVPPEKMRERLQKQIADFNLLKRVVELRNRGATWADIKSATGVVRRSARLWVEGKREPIGVSLSKLEHFQRMRKPISITPDKHPQFGYVLGAFFCKTFTAKESKGGAEARLELQTKDRDFAREFALMLKATIGRQWKRSVKKVKGIISQRVSLKLRSGKKIKVQRTAFFSMELLQLLNGETDFGAKIPLKFLGKREARVNFLKAVFDARGQISYTPHGRTPYIEFFTRNKELSDAVSIFLLEQGIIHTRSREKQPFLVRIGLPGLQKFRKIIGFRSKEKQAKISVGG